MNQLIDGLVGGFAEVLYCLYLLGGQHLVHLGFDFGGEDGGVAEGFADVGRGRSNGRFIRLVGEAAPQDPLDARFLRFLSRQPYAVDFKAEQVGKTAFYFARWQTATGETGPWSPVLKMTVAGVRVLRR